MRCQSPICIVVDGIRGREFTPHEDATGLLKIWCPECISLATQIDFYTKETAEMIRKVYMSYANTDLPKEVKLFLKQFTREIMFNLNVEL